jgi:hypothetical protein
MHAMHDERSADMRDTRLHDGWMHDSFKLLAHEVPQ